MAPTAKYRMNRFRVNKISPATRLLLQEQHTDRGANYIPTPEEIQEGTARIRATWSPEQERSARAWSISKPIAYDVPAPHRNKSIANTMLEGNT